MWTRIIVVIGLSLGLFSQPIASAEEPKNTFKSIPGYVGFQFTENNTNLGVVYSSIAGVDPIKNEQYLCKSLQEANCSSNNLNYSAVIVLPVCELASEQPCIQALKFKSKTDEVTEARFVRNIDAATQPAIPNQNLPYGGSTSLWEVNLDSKLYSIAVTSYLNYEKRATSKSFLPSKFTSSIFAYREESLLNARKIEPKESNEFGRKSITSPGPIFNPKCVWQEFGKCGVMSELPKDYAISLKQQIPNTLTGWLHGRLENSILKLEAKNKSLNLLTVEGFPVDVTTAQAEVELAKSDEKIKSLYRNNTHAQMGMWVADNVDVSNGNAFNYLTAFQQKLNNQSTGKQRVWSVSSLYLSNSSNSPCLIDRKKIIGLVSTNSMIYEGNPPSFRNGFLDYRVGGLHFDDTGEVVSGSYDLNLRSETARCLYKLPKVPLSATVSVTTESGVKNVSTTVLNEKDGWVNLSAKNFNFSTPTIRVKISQQSNRKVK